MAAAAGVVDVCMEEFSKLKEKVVRPNKKKQLNLFRTKKAKATDAELQEVEKATGNVVGARNRRSSEDGSLSEATIFLIMDRFAPC